MGAARARPTHLTVPEAGALVTLAALAVVTTVSSLHGRSGRPVAIAVTAAAMLAAGLFAGSAFCAARRAQASMKSALLCLAACGAIDVAAHGILWGWYGVIRGGAIPVASPAYILPISAAGLGVAGCVLLSRARVRIRMAGLLDAVLILAGAGFAGWALVLRAIYQASPGDGLAKALALVPPGANLLFIAILGPVALRVRTNQRFVASFLVCSLPILISNVAFAYLAAVSQYHLGTPIDCGYVLTYLGAALLLRRDVQFQHSSRISAEELPWAYVAVPYAPIVLAGAVLAYLMVTGRGLDGLLVGLGLVLVAAGFLRQMLVINENLSLSRSLATSEARFRHMALHDPLTGLPNRHLFYDRAAQLGEIAKRSDANISVLAIDLDGFKEINDRHGHAAGDEVLVEAGRRLARVLRGTDTAARMGGDEFSVILLGGETVAAQVAERVMSALSSPYALASCTTEVVVGASIGTAVRKPGEEVEDVLRRADHEMYDAKARHHAQLA